MKPTPTLIVIQFKNGHKTLFKYRASDYFNNYLLMYLIGLPHTNHMDWYTLSFIEALRRIDYYIKLLLFLIKILHRDQGMKNHLYY